MNKIKRISGFTLLELMVVVAIVGVLATIGIPSYRSFIAKNRVETSVSTFYGALLLARSEAIKRNAPVTICISNNFNNATPTCTGGSTTGSGWATGWIIFADRNGDGVYAPSGVSPDELVAVQTTIAKDNDDVSIITNVNRDQITFRPTGQVFGSMVQFAVNRPTWDNTSSHDRYICLATGGRARVSETTC